MRRPTGFRERSDRSAVDRYPIVDRADLSIRASSSRERTRGANLMSPDASVERSDNTHTIGRALEDEAVRSANQHGSRESVDGRPSGRDLQGRRRTFRIHRSRDAAEVPGSGGFDPSRHTGAAWAPGRRRGTAACQSGGRSQTIARPGARSDAPDEFDVSTITRRRGRAPGVRAGYGSSVTVIVSRPSRTPSEPRDFADL